mgnify:CR=1 FL=1
MRFEARTFTLAKDAERPAENQDAFRLDLQRGRAAIADGVSSAIFSRQWAGILTESALDDPPDSDDSAALTRWLSGRREAWSAGIDTTGLAWFQKPKLREGAFSTLLWVSLDPPVDGRDEPWRLLAHAVGDSCLFVVRDGRWIRKFPIERAEQLDAAPVVLGSVDLNRDNLVAIHALEEVCLPGDLVVLCTDAVADWALRRDEAGDPPAWSDYWDMTPEAWTEEILRLRDDRCMRCDDATLVLLRALADEPAPAAPAAIPAVPGDALPGVPASIEAGPLAVPPPLPPRPDENRPWYGRLKSLSEQLAGRAVEKLKEAKASVDAAVRKYRDKDSGPGAGDDSRP